MTLLETLVALVILGLSAVGFLELFHGTGRSASDAEAWTRAVAVAESTMETATLSVSGTGDLAALSNLASDSARQVSVRPVNARIVDVQVTVALPRGGRYVLHRLTRLPSRAPGSGVIR
jgi:type II secretory pathway pseudopilin PulG